MGIANKILKNLPTTAFKEAWMKGAMGRLIDEYGEYVYQSIGEVLPFRRLFTIEKFEQRYVISFLPPMPQDNDLLSPPFPVLLSNSMGTFPKNKLDLQFGDMLFEVRALENIGAVLQDKLRKKGVDMTHFLRGVGKDRLVNEVESFFDTLIES